MEVNVHEASIERIVLSSVFVSLTVVLKVIWLLRRFRDCFICDEMITYAACCFLFENDIRLLFIQPYSNGVKLDLQKPSLLVRLGGV